MFDLIERFKSWMDGLNIDYCRWRYVAMSISGVLMVLSWVLFFTVQPNWSTDFTGGTELHLKFEPAIEVDELRQGLRRLQLSDDSVQAVNGSDSGEFLVRISDPSFGMEDMEKEVRDALVKLYGPDWIQSMKGSAEVSARFLVNYKEPYKDYKIVGRELAEVLPGARVVPTKDELALAVEIPGLAQKIQQRIATEMSAHPFEVLAIDSIGPKVGAELRRQGFIALAATLLLILIYVGFRFDLEYAPGAIIALFHDVTLTMGVMVVLQLDFSLQTVGALLTILGFSINDTIVIYDRIRENKDKYRRSNIIELINKSLNETMTRTIATTFTVFLAVLGFLFWGGPVLRDFAIAMLCGLVFGSYSTIYIASPLIIIFQELKPHLAKLVAFGDLGDEIPATLADNTPGPGDPADAGAPGVSADARPADPRAPAPPAEPAAPAGPPLTESEKRRRARAEAEKREQGR